MNCSALQWQRCEAKFAPAVEKKKLLILIKMKMILDLI